MRLGFKSKILPKNQVKFGQLSYRRQNRGLAQQPPEIIWPQVPEDNNTTGETSYYVSLDRSGQVREVLPLSVAIERADDSARRQILKWRFKPVLRDGVPVQTESILTSALTRALMD